MEIETNQEIERKIEEGIEGSANEIEKEITEAEKEITEEITEIEEKVDKGKISQKKADKKIDKEVKEIAEEASEEIQEIKEKSKKQEEKDSKETNLIAIIRISGMVKVKKEIENTLQRLRLRRKYSCVLLNLKNKSLKGMLEKIKYYIAYGEINQGTLVKLIQERTRKIGNKKPKINAKEIAEKLIKGKTLDELELKPFFRLHPPRKGIKSKLQYPKGVLGNNKKDINKLIERML